MLRKSDKNDGFTLVEVVVTMAVLSLSLTVLYQVFSASTRSTRLSSDYYRAMQIAETQMALLTVQPGIRTGSVDDYFYWSTKVDKYSPPVGSPFAPDELVSAIERGLQPHNLTVAVSWGSKKPREIQLNTIRLMDET